MEREIYMRAVTIRREDVEAHGQEHAAKDHSKDSPQQAQRSVASLESSGEQSLLSVSCGSVDIRAEFREQERKLTASKLDEVPEALNQSLEESDLKAMEADESGEEGEDEYQLPEDMVDEGVCVGNMSGFSLIK